MLKNYLRVEQSLFLRYNAEKGVSMERNEKIYKIYRPFSYDYVFLYAVIFLFVTITKGLTVGQYMYLCSIYSIFFAVFQVPLNYVVESLGLKKSMIIGNLLCIVHISIYIFAGQFIFFAIAEVFCALGFVLKGLSETQFLYKTLKNNGKASKYSKIEGKGVAKYYYLEAAGSLFMGYLFTVNNYIPMCLTLLCVIIAFIISLMFKDVAMDINIENTGVKAYVRNFKKIIKSPRLISIFIFAFFATGFIEVIKVLQKSVIVELDTAPTAYTIIIAVFTLAVGLGSRLANRFEKHSKRKTLTIIGISLCLLCIALGSVNYISSDTLVRLYISVTIIFIYNIFQGMYRMCIKKYLNNFTTSSIRGKILAIFYIFEGLGRSILLFISGTVIDNVETSFTCILLGAVMLVIMILILGFMKTRFGLDPEEYSKKDLCGKTASELTK